MVDGVAWGVAVLAGAAALALYWRVRAVGVELGASRIEAEKLRGELAATRDQLAREAAKQRRRAEEQQELRRKLDKAKRRAAQAPDATRGGSASRLSELEAQLEQARQARDAAREEADGLAAEVGRLRAAPKPARPPEPVADAAAVAALRERAATAEADLASVRAQVAAHERSLDRLRGRIRTQEELYVAIRSELAAKKDRLRAQQEEIERLQALKVAFIDAAPAAPAGDDAEGITREA